MFAGINRNPGTGFISDTGAFAKRMAHKKYQYKKSYKRRKTASSNAGANGPGRVNLRALSVKQNTNLVSITRTVDYGQITSSTGTNTFSGQVFKLSDLPNYTQFTNLFDEYRIRAIKCYFIPTFNVNYGTTGTATLPQLISAIDYDDATTPSSTAQIYSFDTCRVHGIFDKMTTRTFKPALSLAVYTGSFVGYGQRQDQWIDCNSPGASHYAMKWGMVNFSNASGVVNAYLEATFYIEFRKAV